MTTSEIISNTQTPSTYTSIAALSLWAMGSLVGGLTLASVPNVDSAIPKFTTKYYSTMDASSYDSVTFALKNDLISKVSIEELLGEFYSEILSSQEELGKEFKDVYFKNAWNLYDN